MGCAWQWEQFRSWPASRFGASASVAVRQHSWLLVAKTHLMSHHMSTSTLTLGSSDFSTLLPSLFKEIRCELQNDAPFFAVTSTKPMCSGALCGEGGVFWSGKTSGLSTGNSNWKEGWKHSFPLLEEERRNRTFKISTLHLKPTIQTLHTQLCYPHNMPFTPCRYFFLTTFITRTVCSSGQEGLC